jgi:hypothetical protein
MNILSNLSRLRKKEKKQVVIEFKLRLKRFVLFFQYSAVIQYDFEAYIKLFMYIYLI